MTDLERLIWAAAYAAEFVRLRSRLVVVQGTSYTSGIEHGAAAVAESAVRRARLLAAELDEAETYDLLPNREEFNR